VKQSEEMANVTVFLSFDKPHMVNGVSTLAYGRDSAC
jgi:hypothetical protein